MTIVSLGSFLALNNGQSTIAATAIGFHWAFYFMIGIAIIGVLISFKLPHQQQAK